MWLAEHCVELNLCLGTVLWCCWWSASKDIKTVYWVIRNYISYIYMVGMRCFVVSDLRYSLLSPRYHLHIYMYTLAVWEATTICPLQVDLWPSDLESGVQVTCDVGYLCANFSLPRPLCSRLRPDVRDRQTDLVRHHASLLNASAWWRCEQMLTIIWHK